MHRDVNTVKIRSVRYGSAWQRTRLSKHCGQPLRQNGVPSSAWSSRCSMPVNARVCARCDALCNAFSDFLCSEFKVPMNTRYRVAGCETPACVGTHGKRNTTRNTFTLCPLHDCSMSLTMSGSVLQHARQLFLLLCVPPPNCSRQLPACSPLQHALVAKHQLRGGGALHCHCVSRCSSARLAALLTS